MKTDGMYYCMFVRFYEPHPHVTRIKGWHRIGPATQRMQRLKLGAAAYNQPIDIWLEPQAPAPVKKKRK